MPEPRNWSDGNLCYDLALYNERLSELSAAQYIAVLHATTKCFFGPSAHLYHEYHDGFTPSRIPKIIRTPCAEASITIAKIAPCRSLP
jgi:hypothetical protein